MKIWERAGLIGGSGFVGGNLSRQRPFARSYSSKTIGDIAGERFDTLVCAGAPAVMWAANADPEGDRQNLGQLAENIASARFDRLVLISTVAVLDDLAAGHTESLARYEQAKAYGRNRRELEQRLIDAHGATVLRLPALFGNGLRKNYLYDLANPLPSFLKPERLRQLGDSFGTDERAVLDAAYKPAPAMNMMQLDQAAVATSDHRDRLTAAFEREQATAKYFTNSRSTYQFYNLANLADDIERTIAAEIDVVHVCSAPILTDVIHEAIFGTSFHNQRVEAVQQDMRTDHAGTWGQTGPYLYDGNRLLAEIVSFVRSLAS